MAHRVPIDPDKGVNDLVRQLADDSRRLLRDELRLARIETSENMHRAGRGVVWLGLAFGVGVVMLVALTLFSVTAIGRVAGGHYWVGAMVTAAIEIAIGIWLLKQGADTFGDAPYSMPETRSALRIIRNS
ncbi:MAG: phage holin family protein [Gemmatimonadaceae bacterium]